jgi:hypothetical protein
VECDWVCLVGGLEECIPSITQRVISSLWPRLSCWGCTAQLGGDWPNRSVGNYKRSLVMFPHADSSFLIVHQFEDDTPCWCSVWFVTGRILPSQTWTWIAYLLWTYLDLQDKSHPLASELIPPPPDPHWFLSPNTPVCTGPSARSLDASGMPRLTIVPMCGTFILALCGTYYDLILICLLIRWLTVPMLLFLKVQKCTLWYHSLLILRKSWQAWEDCLLIVLATYKSLK